MSVVVMHAFFAILSLAGCSAEEETPPQPQQPDSTAVSYFCAMMVSEHKEPGGQVFQRGYNKPVWLASVRDIFAYLEFEVVSQTDVTAIYVTDMSNGAPGAWIEARTAHYVVSNSDLGGASMSRVEALPFSTRAAADAFCDDNSGQVVDFDSVRAVFSFGG